MRMHIIAAVLGGLSLCVGAPAVGQTSINARQVQVDGVRLDTALAAKADASALTSGLATKADATATTSALATKAPLASPTLTGAPAAPTPTAGDSSTRIATTAFVGSAITTGTAGKADASALATTDAKAVAAQASATSAGTAATAAQTTANTAVTNAAAAQATANSAASAAATNAAAILRAKLFVTLEDYGGGPKLVSQTSSQNAALNDAAFTLAIAAANGGQKAIYLAGTGPYYVSQTILINDTNTSLRTAKGIIGNSMYGSDILMITDNIPIVETVGQDKVFENLGLKYVNPQAETATHAIALNTTGLSSFNYFHRLRIENAWRGMDNQGPGGDGTQNQGNFSSSYDTIRFLNSCDDNIVGSASAGTGNDVRNIYASAPGRDRVNHLLSFVGQVQGSVGQINAEQANVIGSALRLTNSSAIDIRAINIENVRLFDNQNVVGLIDSSAQAARIGSVTGTFIHWGGYRVTSAVRGSGNSITLTLDGFGGSAFTNSGAGLRTGDTVTIDGYDTVSGAQTATVTGYTNTTVTVDAPNLATSGLTLASGAEYATIARGNGANVVFPLVALSGSAETFEIGSWHSRNSYIYGKNSGTRVNVPTYLKNAGSAGRLRIFNLVRHARNGGLWDGDIPIVGVSRTSNVATIIFQQKHFLKQGDIFRVTSGTLPCSVGGYATVLGVVDDFTVTISSTGTDCALAPSTGTGAAYVAIPTVSVSRTSNVATYTLASAHTMSVGENIRVADLAQTGFTVSNATITAVTSTTISYPNTGSDLATTADTTTAIVPYEGIGQAGKITSPSTAFQGVQVLGDTFSAAFVTAAETITAGSVGTARTIAMNGARPGDVFALSLNAGASLPIGAEIRVYVAANDNVTVAPDNFSASSITMPALRGTIRKVN